MTIAKEWDTVQSLLFEAENKVDELEKAYLNASNQMEMLTAEVTRLTALWDNEVEATVEHGETINALRAENQQIRDRNRVLDEKIYQENAKLREALEEIKGHVEHDHPANHVARAALTQSEEDPLKTLDPNEYWGGSFEREKDECMQPGDPDVDAYIRKLEAERDEWLATARSRFNELIAANAEITRLREALEKIASWLVGSEMRPKQKPDVGPLLDIARAALGEKQ
jgi:chromosome segregation ATPase